jgi:chemotaxis protein methyltransferase CheR
MPFQLMVPSGHLFFSGVHAPAPRRVRRPTEFAGASRWPAVVVPTPEGDQFLGWLLAQVGLDATDYRATALSRRLPACLRELRAATVEEARRRLERHPELVAAAVDTVLLGVTDFYRDAAVFAALRDRVLPDLLARSDRIRVWSAACSDGPEVYSVAMMLADLAALPRADVVGSDCRPTAIMRAVSGVYSKDALDRARGQVRREYFTAVGSQRVQVTEGLRSSVRWRVSDLMQQALPGPWDLILWRNMAIYLTPASAEAVWRRVVAELRPGGYLVIGKADHPPRELQLTRLATCLYQRPEVTDAP